MTMKWRGHAALARTTGPTATASPSVYLNCDDANGSGEPILVERINNITADVLSAVPVGFNYKFTASAIEADAPTMGKLFWLFLGTESPATDTHTITPASVQQYFEFFTDRGLDLGTSTPTEVLLGCKMESLEFEVKARQFAKFAISGLACNKGTAVAALSPTAQVTAAYAPLSWMAIKSNATPFKIGYAAATPAADTAITGFKLSLKRTLREKPVDLSSDVPSGIDESGRTIEFEITREFTGAGALAAYNAWAAQSLVGIELNATMGTNTLKIEIPQAVITGSFAEGVGTGDDQIMGTLKCRATTPSAVSIITVTVKDGASGAYT